MEFLSVTQDQRTWVVTIRSFWHLCAIKLALFCVSPLSVIHKVTCISRLTSLYLFMACKHFWRHKSCVKEITFARCHNVWTLGCFYLLWIIFWEPVVPWMYRKGLWSVADDVSVSWLKHIQQMSGQIKASGEDAAEEVTPRDQLWHNTSDWPDHSVS